MNRSRKTTISRKRFNYALKMNKTNFRRLSEAIYVSHGTLYDAVKHGSIMPDMLEDCCRVLDVSPEYIKGKENKKADNPDEIIFDDSFSEDEKKEIIEDIQRRTDPEGFAIPSYKVHEINEKSQSARELLLEYLSGSGSSPLFYGKNRVYFEKHFEEIQDLITTVVHGFIVTHKD